MPQFFVDSRGLYVGEDPQKHGSRRYTDIQPPEPYANFYWAADEAHADGGVWTARQPEPEPEPTDADEITRLQMDLYLNGNGFVDGLENASVVAAVTAAGLSDSTVPIKYRSAVSFRIDDPLMVSLASALGIPDLQAAFNAAAQL